ncbi:MAG: helix-turn-helix domain-containing protein [Kiritimatiellae bacterium]|nr:helix-turn-helix domain-containing protein [Kiritimatiellia bacterium]
MENRKDVLVMLSPVSQPRLQGIAKFAKEHGWNLLVKDRQRAEIPGWKTDGAIATVRTGSPIVANVRRLLKRGVPVVDLTCEMPRMDVVRVTSDHVMIGRLAAEHFERHHFTSRAWFSSGWGHVHALRFKGFTEERPAAKWVGEAPVERVRRPLAVLTYDETDAACLMRKCLALGIAVPEEISILSIGNDPVLSELQPIPVSSIDQDLERGGYVAAAVLYEMMEGRAPASRHTIIPPKCIVTRKSTDTLAVDDPTVRAAVLFIRSNLSRSIGAAQVAEHVGVSRSRIDKLFSATLGRPIGEEILRQRLAHVKTLLRNSELTAMQIAEKCGFCSPSHLNNVFKRETGMTPRAWRQQ